MSSIAAPLPSAPTARASWFEKGYVVLTLVLSAGGLNGLFFRDVTDSLNDSNSLRLAVALGLYLIAVLLLIRRHRAALFALIMRQWGIVLLLGIILLSATWSVETGATFRRAIAFFLTAMFAVYVTLQYDLRQILRLLGLAALVMMMISIANMALNPDELIVAEGRKVGAWTNGLTGLTFFGRVVAVSMLILYVTRKDAGVFGLASWLGFGLCMLVLVKVQAASALVAGFVTLFVMVVFERLRAQQMTLGAVIATGLGLAVPLTIIYVSSSDAIFEALGRDPTLTHRTRIWELATAYAMEQHPLLGAGFRSFWTDEHSAPVQFLIFGSRLTNFGNGHSGYIDIWLEIGVPGALCMALLLLFAVVRSLHLLLYHPDDWIVFLPGFIFFMLLYNISEKSFLEHTEFASIIFLIVLLKTTWLCALRIDRSAMPLPLRQQVVAHAE